MVGKVIKHEFNRTGSQIAVFIAIVSVIVLLAAALSSTGWAFISDLGMPLGFSAVGSLVCGVLALLGVDYWRSSYSKEGYFTQSLPVKGSTIYFSKLSYSLATYLLVLLVAVGLALVLAASVMDVAGWLSRIWSTLSLVMPVWAWIGLPILMLLVVASWVVQILFAASVGSEPWLRRLGNFGPILVWFGTYLLIQLLIFISIMAIPVTAGIGSDGKLQLHRVNNMIALLFEGSRASEVPIGFVAVYPLILALMIWRTALSWNKKVSLA